MIRDRLTSRPQTSDAAAWTLLLLLTLAVSWMQWRSPLTIDRASLRNLTFGCAALSATAIFYRHVRPEEKFAIMCIGLMQVLLFSTIGAILSYLLAREGGALWDGRLAEWDRALGLDWMTYARWIDDRPTIVSIFRYAYASLIPQVIALVLVFGFTLRVAELRALLLAAMICGSVSILLSPLFPAVGNYAHLGLARSDFDHVWTFVNLRDVQDFTAIRNGSLHELRLRELQGIIVFPSYHAGLATVTCWGFWRTQRIALRSVGCGVALLTVAATPVEGGHYFVDVLAGILIGMLSIAAAKRAILWSPDLTLTAWPFRRSHAASAP